jgi:hypothetical protein
MPRKVKVVNINEESSYGDVAEAIVENEKAESQPSEETQTEEVEPEPPKPKARAKRVPKPKAVVDDVPIEIEPEPVAPKPRAKRAPKVKVAELPPVVEEPIEKPKAVRKPRAPKQEMHVQQPNNQVPAFPPRLSRTAAREALYHSLASGGLA